MTTVHARYVGDDVVLPRAQLERLVELAGQVEKIDLHVERDEIPTAGIMRLAEEGGAFDWLAHEKELYSVADLKLR